MLNFRDACEHVYRECPDAWAKAYAKIGLKMTESDDRKSQAQYILSNLRYWRGDTAKMVKTFLGEFIRS